MRAPKGGDHESNAGKEPKGGCPRGDPSGGSGREGAAHPGCCRVKTRRCESVCTRTQEAAAGITQLKIQDQQQS